MAEKGKRASDVRERAGQLGVDVDDERDGTEPHYLVAEAPRGWRFRGPGTHSIVAPYVRGSKASAWAMLAEDLEAGVERCPRPEADAECIAHGCADDA